MLTLIVPVFGTYGLKDVTPNRDGNRVIKVNKIVYPNDTFPVVECFECVETTFQLKGIRGIAEIERGKVIVINVFVEVFPVQIITFVNKLGLFIVILSSLDSLIQFITANSFDAVEYA